MHQLTVFYLNDKGEIATHAPEPFKTKDDARSQGQSAARVGFTIKADNNTLHLIPPHRVVSARVDSEPEPAKEPPKEAAKTAPDAAPAKPRGGKGK